MTKKMLSHLRPLIGLLVAVAVLFGTALMSLAATTPVRQTVRITQTIKGTPEKTSYVYALVQTRGDAVLPDEDVLPAQLTENDTLTIHFSFTAPGVYEYTIGRLTDEEKTSGITLEDLETGNEVEPPFHPFGFKVTTSEDGSLKVTPYTCYDDNVILFADGSGLTLKNVIDGTKGCNCEASEGGISNCEE